MTFAEVAAVMGRPALAVLAEPAARMTRSAARYVVTNPTFQRAMNQSLAEYRERAAAEAIRPLAAADSKPARPAKALDRPETYTVRGGDSLSRIVRARLTAQGERPSNSDVYSAVARVAAANWLDDPDMIRTGQQLDLSPLDAGQGGPARGDLTHILEEIFGEKSADAVEPDVPWSGAVVDAARVSSGYGVRRDPFTGGRDFHDGMDLAARAGTPIRALRSGEVTFSGWQAGYGRVVVVRHADGLESVYGHNEANLVAVGDRVARGETLARVGSTGRSTGPHVHFEVRRAGRAVDPTPYLEAAERLQLASN